MQYSTMRKMIKKDAWIQANREGQKLERKESIKVLTFNTLDKKIVKLEKEMRKKLEGIKV